MAFPVTPILDAFNRVETPLSNGGKWTTPLQTGNTTMNGYATDAATSSSGNFADAYWNVAQFTDSEVYANILIASGGFFILYIRTINPGATPSGYIARFNGGDNTVAITRNDSGSESFLVDNPLTMSNNDQIGLSITGSTLNAYQNGTVVATVTDATYAGPGYIGLGTTTPDASAFANFGGGSSTPPTVPVPLSLTKQTNFIHFGGI